MTAVLLFVRAPLAGPVKTRLAATIGAGNALALYRDFVLDTLDAVRGSGLPCLVFHHPPEAAQEVRDWLGPDLPLLPQHGADLGDRMERAFRDAFSLGFSSAMALGSDIPGITPDILIQGASGLDSHSCVIGPAPDGGYYLIGLRGDSLLPEIFSSIPWSTPEVLPRTLAILAGRGLQPLLLSSGQDVDTVEDLRTLLRQGRDTPFARTRTWRRAVDLLGKEGKPGEDGAM